jgi:hypothetical protein
MHIILVLLLDTDSTDEGFGAKRMLFHFYKRTWKQVKT